MMYLYAYILGTIISYLSEGRIIDFILDLLEEC